MVSKKTPAKKTPAKKKTITETCPMCDGKGSFEVEKRKLVGAPAPVPGLGPQAQRRTSPPELELKKR